MLIQEVVLRYDFHARPATHFVSQVSRFKSDITIISGSREAAAKSILSIMTLELAQGDTIQILIDGIDEKEAMEKIICLIEYPIEKDW